MHHTVNDMLISIGPAVSHAHLESLEGYDRVHKTLQLPPTVERDVYCAEIMVQTGKSTALVCVHRGTCYVNGEEVREGEKPRRMKNGNKCFTRCMQTCVCSSM
jgi:hypothetical protein